MFGGEGKVYRRTNTAHEQEMKRSASVRFKCIHSVTVERYETEYGSHFWSDVSQCG